MKPYCLGQGKGERNSLNKVLPTEFYKTLFGENLTLTYSFLCFD